MPEPPIVTLQRWVDHGANWRVASLGEQEATVELCACTGEVVDVMRSADPELLQFLRELGPEDG
jgi:hypothetical protein